MTSPTLDNFLQLLLESGLPQDRLEYYLHRLKHHEFNEEDHQNLTEEIQKNITQLDETIEGMEQIIAEKEESYTQQQQTMLPYLQKIAEVQPAVQKQELEDYKRELGTATGQYMHQLENVRHTSEKSQIDALHSFLKKGN